jgi:hypothetical protein
VTVFVWDASSYDGLIPVDTFRRAMAEGIVAFVHRLTRQGGLIDPYAGRNLAAARDAGLKLVGAYAVTYTSGSHQQDELTMRQADQVCPWWRTFPGWWWMEDLERWPSDAVPADLGIAVARELEAGSGRRCSLYASHGQYGDQLHQLLTGTPTAPVSPDATNPQEVSMFLATDGKQYYVCDGQVSRPVSLADAQIIAYGKTSGYGPTFPQLVVGDPNHNPVNGAHEWADLPRQEGGVYARYVRLGWGTWAGALPTSGGGTSGAPAEMTITLTGTAVPKP